MVKKLVYRAHVQYMAHLDRVDVKRRLVTFNADPNCL